MATKKADGPPKPISLGTYTNLVGRKAHPVEQLRKFWHAYKEKRKELPGEFPVMQTRQDWEYSFEAWERLEEIHGEDAGDPRAEENAAGPGDRSDTGGGEGPGLPVVRASGGVAPDPENDQGPAGPEEPDPKTGGDGDS